VDAGRRAYRAGILEETLAARPSSPVGGEVGGV
jgi:thiazole synthase ThiGH ThiG subunit